MKRRKPDALDLFSELNAALDQAGLGRHPDRGALEVPTGSIQAMITAFSGIMLTIPLESRLPLLHGAVGRMAAQDYPLDLVSSVLNQSGISPEQMQAYRLDLKTSTAPAVRPQPRL